MVPRRTVSGLAPAAVLAAVALGIGGCGDDASPSADPADTSMPTEPTEPTTEPTNEPDDDPTHKETLTVDASDVVQLEIEIEDGGVEPTARQVEVNVGTIVLFEVDSDVADELHIHSAPEERTFAIKARDDQQFKLTVEQPGQFDVELHESGTLVAQLVVRP